MEELELKTKTSYVGAEVSRHSLAVKASWEDPKVHVRHALAVRSGHKNQQEIKLVEQSRKIGFLGELPVEDRAILNVYFPEREEDTRTFQSIARDDFGLTRQGLWFRKKVILSSLREKVQTTLLDQICYNPLPEAR